MAEFNLHSAAFPTLDESQIRTLQKCTGATIKKYKAGEKLFAAGDQHFKFFLVKSGEIEIFDPSEEPPRSLFVHTPGQFTGDIAHLTGTASVVDAVAKMDCEVFEISADTLRQALMLCSDISDIILQAFIARRQLLTQPGSFAGLRLIGSRYSRDTFRIREFLSTNCVPFNWLDLESEPEIDQILQRFNIQKEDTPVVIWQKRILRNPSNEDLANLLGLRKQIGFTVYDLAIVGAGPAGLAAAVYGSSEGLKTVLLERFAPGGQAGRSMKIENYLGFPTGISGRELAERAVLQASKFGTVLSVPAPVKSLAFDHVYAYLELEDGAKVISKCLLIATGADYRQLPVEGCTRFEGCGVYYAATLTEGALYRGADVVVVGSGNSAGQAAIFLAKFAKKVYIVVRGDDLKTHMSSYLIQRILQQENIEVLYKTEVVGMHGKDQLAFVEIIDQKTGKIRTIETPAVFSFIGAAPRTNWLPSEIQLDAHNFIRTGPSLDRSVDQWSGRDPFLLETSKRGIFAAGDVRSGSIKRVASAVGEGAMTVQFVHQYLGEM